MRVIKSDQVRQRAKVGVRQRLQILRDLRFELEQQRGEFVAGVSEDVASVGVDNRRTQIFHHGQRVFRESDSLFVTWNAAPVVAVIEIPNVTADPHPLERTALQELRVIDWQRLAGNGAERCLHDAKQNRDVGHATPHWTGGVLLMTDRNDTVLRNEPQRRLQAEDVFNGGRTGDGAVSLGADRCRAQTCGRRCTRTGA